MIPEYAAYFGGWRVRMEPLSLRVQQCIGENLINVSMCSEATSARSIVCYDEMEQSERMGLKTGSESKKVCHDPGLRSVCRGLTLRDASIGAVAFFSSALKQTKSMRECETE